ncbi:hypothetical protein ACXR2T_11485 [Leucobacter sp. HY1910]
MTTSGTVRRRGRISRGVGGMTLTALVVGALAVAGATAAAYVDQANARSEPLTAHVPPPFLTGLTSARSVDTGVGLGTDNTVYVWGNTNDAKAGSNRGGLWQKATPVGGLPVGEMSSVAGGIYNYNALQSSGHVWGWGTIPARDGTGNQRPDNRPAQIRIGSHWNGAGPLLENIGMISSSEQAGAAVRNDGTVWAWGEAGYGGMSGRGATQVPGLPDPSSGDAFPMYLNGAYNNFWVILSNGEVWYWGSQGSMPRADQASLNQARQSKALSPWFKNNVGQGEPYIVQVAGGIDMGHAVLSNGRVLTWGGNDTRIGGRPSGGGNPAPHNPGLVPESSLANITSTAAGFTGTILLDANQNLYGYGASDDYGKFPQSPVLVSSDVVDFSAGQGFYIWRLSSGENWGQGYNAQGVLGKPVGASKRLITDIGLGVFG